MGARLKRAAAESADSRARADTPHAAVPPHEVVARALRQRIESGAYPEREMLPAELRLLAEFNVGRYTMRRALQSLVDEGLIERRAGRGTTVSPRSPANAKWALRSIGDLVGEFETGQFRVLKHGPVAARQFPDIARMFGIRPSGTFYCIERLIDIGGTPGVYNRLFTPIRYACRIPPEVIGTRPLIEQIEQYARVEAHRTRQSATATGATPAIAKMVGLPVGAPMLMIRRTYLSRDGIPIEFTEFISRPDRYEQIVEFYREPTNSVIR